MLLDLILEFFVSTKLLAFEPGKKCDPNNPGKTCLQANQQFPNKDKNKTVQNLRIIGIITGFMLVLPLALNIAQMSLAYLNVPGAKSLSNVAGDFSRTLSQKGFDGANFLKNSLGSKKLDNADLKKYAPNVVDGISNLKDWSNSL